MSNQTPGFQVLHLDHVVIRTAHIDRMLHFYTKVLGCPLERRLETPPLLQVRAGSSLIDLLAVEQADAAITLPANMDHFCLAIEPFDATALRAYLASHDIACGEAATRYGADGFGPSVYIKDPDGNVVELKGPPREPPLGGAV